MLKKKTVLVLIALIMIATFATCKGGDSSSSRGSAAPPSALSLASNVTGEVTLMMWAGDDQYWEDMGSLDLPAQNFTAINVAAAYAVTKEFKKVYPNVKVNLFAKSGGDSDANGSWEQHRENFRMQYGKYPDAYVATDMVGDMQRGLIADLSIFRNDPMYLKFIPSVMEMLSVGGHPFGLPQYIIPGGVWINKSLAEANNIDVPDPNWTIAEYTRFINSHRPNEYYGSMGGYGNDLGIINTGTRDFSYMLVNHEPGSNTFVNITSDATRALLRYIPQWRANSLSQNNDLGLVSQEFRDAHGNYSWRYFASGRLLTLNQDPWQYGAATNPDPNSTTRVRAADWDLYPRPSTPYMGNTLGITLDPFVIHNFAMDDGNPALSATEEAKLRLAWEFLKFWCGDNRSWQARADQQYLSGETLTSALNDSFPVCIGDDYSAQMGIWFQTDRHQRYANKTLMPGFHYVMELWEKGQFWDISSKNFPWNFDFEGGRRGITYEWGRAWDPNIVGVVASDPSWLDQVYARLPQWNTLMNQRWANEYRLVDEAIARYYPLP